MICLDIAWNEQQNNPPPPRNLIEVTEATGWWKIGGGIEVQAAWSSRKAKAAEHHSLYWQIQANVIS